MRKISTLIAGSAVAAAMTLSAGAMASGVKDVWLTEAKTSKIEVYDCGDKLCGKIVWLEEPNNEDGTPKLDSKNPDESKRKNPLMGTNIIWEMAPDGDNAWDDGKIYDAGGGKVYSSEMKLEGDNLLVSGCIAFFCEEQTWTRSSM